MQLTSEGLSYRCFLKTLLRPHTLRALDSSLSISLIASWYHMTENHCLWIARGGQHWYYHMGGESYVADLPWQFDKLVLIQKLLLSDNPEEPRTWRELASILWSISCTKAQCYWWWHPTGCRIQIHDCFTGLSSCVSSSGRGHKRQEKPQL